MDKVLYLIDPTARQYGFEFGVGFRIRVNGQTFDISEETDLLGVFHDIIENNRTFIIDGGRGAGVFSGSKIIGIKIGS